LPTSNPSNGPTSLDGDTDFPHNLLGSSKSSSSSSRDTLYEYSVSTGMLSQGTASAFPLLTAASIIDQPPYLASTTALQPHGIPEFTTSASSYSVKADADSLQAILFSSNADHSAITSPTSAITMVTAASEQSSASDKRRNGKKETVKAGGIKKAKAAASNSLAADRADSRQRKDSIASSNADSYRDENDNDNDNDNDGFDDNGRNSVGVKDSKTEHERRRKFLERNRLAASKCRQKKKMWVQELERRAEDATMQNRSLQIAVAQLKEEVLILKNQLLAHHSCGCTAVQQYIQSGCGAPATGPSVAHAVSAAVVASGFSLPTHSQQTLTSPTQTSIPVQHPLPLPSQPSSAAMAAVVAAATSANQSVNMNVSAAAPSLLLQPPPLSQPQQRPRTQTPALIHSQQQIQRSQGFQGHNPYYMSQNPHQVDLSAVLTTTSSTTGSRAYSGGEV
ncbi:hypothetical protein GGI23_005424, partial [Coemansia sp. RSA 2559]